MGQTPGSGTYHIEHDQAFKTQPKYFSAHNDGGKLLQKKHLCHYQAPRSYTTKKPNRRHTWDKHRVQIWYIVPEVEHYRCYKVYIYNTREEKITDTVELFPKNTTITLIYSAYEYIHAETHLIITLENTATDTPFSPLRIEKLNALRKLAEIFQVQITQKIELDTTEKKTKLVEQNQNRNHPPPRVKAQSVTIPELPTHQKRRKAKTGITPSPHQIPFEEN